MPFTRRTAFAPLPLPSVLLLDTIGELAALFERAGAVFMGGTLAQRGGHNILEPAYFGKPIIVGPHMENFAAIAEEFHDARRAGSHPKARGTRRAPSTHLLADGSALGAARPRSWRKPSAA